LDWEAQKNPLVTLLEGRYPLPVKEHMAVTRSDTNSILGVVGAKYKTIQNSSIWEALNQSLDSQGINYEISGGGYFAGGSKVFLQVSINEEQFKVNGEEFNNFLTFSSSHDGSGAFEVFDTSVRIICQNTIQSAKRAGGKVFKLKVRHTSGASLRFNNVMQALEKLFSQRAETFRDLNSLTSQPMGYQEMINWAVGFFNSSNELTTASHNKAREVTSLAIRGRGNRGETKYDLLNGVTELLTHGQRESKKDRFAIWQTSEHGTASKQKAGALDNLIHLPSFEMSSRRGEALLRGEKVANA
jgi:phage/plasmid-like protein (TIGR03299 family)